MGHKVGDTVTVTRGPHKGDAHKVIHVHKDGRVNVKPHNKMPHQIKYRHGAATAKPGEVKRMSEALSIKDVEKATAMAKKRQEKERKTTGRTNVSVKDLGARQTNELSKTTLKNYKKAVTKRIKQHATGEYHPTDNHVKMDWELDQYQDKARVHGKMRDVAKKKIAAKGKKEGTIITKPGFKMKPDDQNKLKKIADLMKRANEACWDSHKQVGFKMKGGKRVPNCVPKNENQSAALMKKLAKSAQSSEKGKKAVTLKKAPFDIPSKKDMMKKDEGAMKRIATSQSSKADRMAPGRGLNTFKKKPGEKKDMMMKKMRDRETDRMRDKADARRDMIKKFREM